MINLGSGNVETRKELRDSSHHLQGPINTSTMTHECKNKNLFKILDPDGDTIHHKKFNHLIIVLLFRFPENLI